MTSLLFRDDGGRQDWTLGGYTTTPSGLCARLCHAFLVPNGLFLLAHPVGDVGTFIKKVTSLSADDTFNGIQYIQKETATITSVLTGLLGLQRTERLCQRNVYGPARCTYSRERDLQRLADSKRKSWPSDQNFEWFFRQRPKS